MNAGEAETSDTVTQVADEATEAKVQAEEAIDDKKEAEQDSNTKAVMFKCVICDFESNRESGVKIHMTKNHKNIEQLDGFDEDTDTSEVGELDEDFDLYLKTGKFHCVGGPLSAVWYDIVSEVLSYSKNLSEEEQGREILNLLDVRSKEISN